LTQLEQRRDEAQKNIERVKFTIDQVKIKIGALAQDLKGVESDSKRTNEQLSLAKVSLAKFETQRESAQARLLDLDRRLE
jgi:septal ring factor EnvC (AmiA/AmiB activator)